MLAVLVVLLLARLDFERPGFFLDAGDQIVHFEQLVVCHVDAGWLSTGLPLVFELEGTGRGLLVVAAVQEARKPLRLVEGNGLRLGQDAVVGSLGARRVCHGREHAGGRRFFEKGARCVAPGRLGLASGVAGQQTAAHYYFQFKSQFRQYATSSLLAP